MVRLLLPLAGYLAALVSLVSGVSVHGASLASSASPLDAYLSRSEPVYGYKDTGVRIKTLMGGTGHVLNVTSQTWLDKSRAAVQSGVPGGTAVWTHQVILVVPKKLTNRNTSMAYLTGGCNANPSVPTTTDEDLAVADITSMRTGSVSIVVYQIPNCKIVYGSDPSKKAREEDAMIAWAWKRYMDTQDPEWLPRLPMAKAAMQAMRAAQDYANNVAKVAEVSQWVVAGASKRGWTTWMVGAAARCPTCPKIAAVAPLVPIAPNIRKDMHRQFMSYGGWTFAFSDYLAVNLTAHIDDAKFTSALDIIDPASPRYYDRLAAIPKFVIVSSDDEFMQFDWTDIWHGDGSGAKPGSIGGELHLTIANNAEHSLATGLPEVLGTLAAGISSVARGHGRALRPSFTHTVDNATGAITVTVPAGVAHGKVVLRHATTISSQRRDFRWVRLASNATEPCKFPEITLKKPVFGGNCVQPIVWLGKTLDRVQSSGDGGDDGSSNSSGGDALYRGIPPAPKNGKWVGYYVEVYFPSDTGLKAEFQLTTPGYVWPNTLPFKDCAGAACAGHLL